MNRIADVLQSKYGFELAACWAPPRGRRSYPPDGAEHAAQQAAGDDRERDNLLIYYAGHGQLDSITEKGYWVQSTASSTMDLVDSFFRSD